MCAGASIGDANPDTATGKEGDVEARCFRESGTHTVPTNGQLIAPPRTGLSARPVGRHAVPVNSVRAIIGSRC